ncbi:lysophospholipase [Mucilaginibacter pallidiroseus]|uniref:Lysophospholipase n=1 Tax=Mucilaginibacter pallidiroseus TaxID=2599295 RepID=A0A563U4R8_9SPHI|nr:alpha/beta hydrolase [Mucilaginibacter pallidiroseus]TWR26327.1 lysophospholipase [Mucilaginibacter pallidiroseus]
METSNQPKPATFINQKGQHVYYRNWVPEGKPKGIILIIHGLNSHGGYYQNFAAQLRENGFEVYAIDLAGRGRSEGERYYIADYHDVFADIDLLMNIASSACPLKPIFLFGHSAGGVFASAYAIENQSKLQGLISESFAFKIPAPAFALAAIKFLARIIPHTRLVKLNNEDFSRDSSVVLKMDKDPLLENEKQPAKTMQQLLLAAEYLKKGMPAIKLPILILHGTADKATEPAGSEYFVEHASSADKQLNLYEGHYHDLLNDKYNGIVSRDILLWLNQRV